MEFFFIALYQYSTMKLSPVVRQSILASALFIILSSGPAYKLTSTLLPTEAFGTPTRLGLVLHAAVCFVLFMFLSKHI